MSTHGSQRGLCLSGDYCAPIHRKCRSMVWFSMQIWNQQLAGLFYSSCLLISKHKVRKQLVCAAYSLGVLEQSSQNTSPDDVIVLGIAALQAAEFKSFLSDWLITCCSHASLEKVGLAGQAFPSLSIWLKFYSQTYEAIRPLLFFLNRLGKSSISVTIWHQPWEPNPGLRFLGFTIFKW